MSDDLVLPGELIGTRSSGKGACIPRRLGILFLEASRYGAMPIRRETIENAVVFFITLH
jgi:hypothetical protein